MKKKLILFIGVFFLITSYRSAAQDCEIRNRVQPDGSMLYYMDPEKLYESKTKSLYGAIATDGENYFLSLIPYPTPPKEKTKKISGNLEVTLQDGSKQILEHFDSQYIHQDTVLAILFTITKKQLPEFQSKGVKQVNLDLAKTEKENYHSTHNEKIIQQQLLCFKNRGGKFR